MVCLPMGEVPVEANEARNSSFQSSRSQYSPECMGFVVVVGFSITGAIGLEDIRMCMSELLGLEGLAEIKLVGGKTIRTFSAPPGGSSLSYFWLMTTLKMSELPPDPMASFVMIGRILASLYTRSML